jgi:hypothetical protein
MENTASDLSARLLATENLSVIRARTQTASFDIKSRVLTLPLWKDMTPEIEDMLVGHEVGHALYTGEEYLKPIRENVKMMSYLNIIEDVRIEKLMKRRYPGLRKRMNEGYKQLNDRDFFGVKQLQSFDELLLIDKINLYFKAGFQCGVTFTPEEKQFVNRAERVETIEEVIQLADDIYAFSKEQMEERKKRISQDPIDEMEEDEDENEDLDGDGGEYDDFDDGINQDTDEDSDKGRGKKSQKEQNENSNSNKHTNDQVSDSELESKTERNFSKKLEDLADTNTVYEYWKFDKNYFKDPIIGYKRILSETMSPEAWYASEEYDRNTRHMNPAEIVEFMNKQLAEYSKFKTESSSTVNYLVKEFEMKKSAQTYKRAQVSKIGSLDMAKIYSYKLKDDLFKRITMLPQGKNHGMVMLVDWSGSMNEVLQDTLKQVINLAMFCTRTQIPYRVFAFTNGYNDEYKSLSPFDGDQEMYQQYQAWKRSKMEDTQILTNATSRFNLLELFSSKMTTTEFNSMAKRVLHYSFQCNNNYSTSSTPLNEALVWCYQHIGTYIKNNNIEKMTFITLTDGDGHGLSAVNSNIPDYSYTGDNNKRLKVKNFIKDEVTQKTYELSSNGSSQTEMILRMIKDRYGISVVGFHICGGGRRELMSVLNCNLPSYAGDRYSIIENWRTEFRKEGFVSLKNTGRDELFLITKQSTKIQEGELETNADMNARAIAKNFGKYLNVKKTSRVLLNRFVTLVA